MKAPMPPGTRADSSGLLAGHSDEQGSNPLTPCRLTHLSTSSIFVVRAGAAFQQQPDDARLLLACLLRTAPSSPSGLNGEVQGRRPSLIWRSRVCTTIQQRSDRGQRPCSHSSVQGRHAGAIQGVGICANRQEVLDRLSLRRRIPAVGVRRVVKGFGSATILRAAIRPVRNKEFCDPTAKRGGSHMQSRVAGVKVVSDFAEKEGRCVLARSADFGRCNGKRGIGPQPARHFVDVAIHDLANEIEKDRFHLWHWYLVRLTETPASRGACPRGQSTDDGAA